MKRIIPVGLLCGLLAVGSGCCVARAILYEPLGPGTMCDPEHCPCGCYPTCGCGCGCGCGGGCGPAFVEACGPACAQPCEPACQCGPACATGCGPDCAQPCEPACPTCGPACEPGCCSHQPWGPLSLVTWLFDGEYWCGTGCGEIYWGDFHGDPPDCCDPCDRCGNFTGVHVDGCVGGCADGCVGGCANGCTGGCANGCTGGCAGGCANGCAGGCTNGCANGYCARTQQQAPAVLSQGRQAGSGTGSASGTQPRVAQPKRAKRR